MVTKVLVSKSMSSPEPERVNDTDDEKSSDGMFATVAETQRTVTSEIIAAKKIFFIMLDFRVLLFSLYNVAMKKR